MKLADLFDKSLETPKAFRTHSENDLISSIKKVIHGSHFNTMPFVLKSSDHDLGRGLLKFSYKHKSYKITHEGKIYQGTKLLDEFKKNADIHAHYSSALHMLAKRIKEEADED